VIPKSSPKELRTRETILKDDPDHCIGGRGSTNVHETRRISRRYIIQPNPQVKEKFINNNGNICGHACDDGFSYTSDNNTDWMTVDDIKGLIDLIADDYAIEKSRWSMINVPQ
jgi:hypothetical protein